jgi:translation initiation factor eIF-2B subunit beta
MFEVFVCEGSGDSLRGHEAAAVLSAPPADAAAAGVRPLPVTLLPDASAFAVMPRVTKVVLGAAAVSLAGEVVAVGGTHAVAAAARACGKPVLVIASALKLLPVASAAGLPGLDAQADPASLLPYDAAAAAGLDAPGALLAPAWNVLPPVCVSLLVTSAGVAAPDQVWRLSEELFGPAGSSDVPS